MNLVNVMQNTVNAQSIVSMGKMSTLYSDFLETINTYFGTAILGSSHHASIVRVCKRCLQALDEQHSKMQGEEGVKNRMMRFMKKSLKEKILAKNHSPLTQLHMTG